RHESNVRTRFRKPLRSRPHSAASPSLEELAEATGLPLGRVRQALRCAEASASLNQAVSPDGDTELADFVADPAAADSASRAGRATLKREPRSRCRVRLTDENRTVQGAGDPVWMHHTEGGSQAPALSWRGC